jgi:cell wall assembly regulator SMI1
MLDSLKQIEDILKIKNAPLIKYLQPAISKEEASSLLHDISISLPEDIYTLYSWHNGTAQVEERPANELLFISLGVFFSLERNLDTYKRSMQIELWESNFFPLFDSGGGDIYLINTDEMSSTYGYIFFYSPALMIVEPEIRYSSLSKLIEVTHKLYSSGGYEIDSDNGLIVDFDKEFEMASVIDIAGEHWYK